MAIAAALPGFYDLGHSVTPTFVFRNIFFFNDLLIVKKLTTTERGKLKKNSRFLSTGHRILPSCDCKVCGTMVATFELNCSLRNLTSWLNSLNHPLKQHLAENISIQRSNCNILGFTGTVALSANEPDFSDLGYFGGHVLSKTKSVTPNFFCLFGNSISILSFVTSLTKPVRGNYWARTSLINQSVC